MIRFATVALTSLVMVLGTVLSGAQESIQVDNLDRQLRKAVSNDDLASVRQLLDKGANIEAKDQNGSAVLAIAAEHGGTNVVKLLLERGADVSAKDQSDETALVRAARAGNAEIVTLLLQRTSDVQEKNQALLEAVDGGPIVIEMTDAEPRASESNRPVSSAALEPPWLRTVKLLLDKGADIEASDQYRGPPLLEAAAHGQTDIAILLLERGADIHATDNYGNTALIAAACECAVATMNSTYDIVKVLLEKGAAVNARNQKGTTALMSAASGFGDAAVVKLLLDSGADPAARDEDGNTALALAIKSDRTDKAQLLKNAVEKAH